MRPLAWAAAAAGGGFLWMWLLVWLTGRLPFLPAYAASLAPVLLLLGAGVAYWRWRDRVRRRRLLEQEFRED